ncbi:MAG: hypothetical protein R3B48_23925 [Kofleriaceae bacterium]
MLAAWPRTNYVPGGGPAHVALVILCQRRLADPLPISRRAHGMPEGDGAAATSIAVRGLEQDGPAFLTDVVEPFLPLLANDVGEDVAARAARCAFAYVVTAELPDPDDLGHVQAAWAIAKCVCEQADAEVVIDVHAVRAHLAADIAALDPARGFEVMSEISLLFDTMPDGTVAAWTAGLRKFGRPDVVFLDVPSETSVEAAEQLRDLAELLAAGERIELGDVVASAAGEREARSLPAERAQLVDGDALWMAPHTSR